MFTYVEEREQAEWQLANLADEDHGLVAILMARDVLVKDGSESIRKLAYEAAKARVERMDLGLKHARQGPQLLCLCADHTTKAFLSAFYYAVDQPEKPIKSLADFVSFAETCLVQITNVPKSSPISRNTFTQLGRILHELFQNTDEWAKADWSNRPLTRSVRGIRFEVVHRTADAVLASVRGSRPLERYVSHAEFQRTSGQQTFLEVSIFDSGPGLAQRWLRRTISEHERIEDEQRAVFQCLQKHATSSLASHRGLGLHRVLSTLSSANGFLRLRTGRLSLFRDFASAPYLPHVSSTDRCLMNWSSGDEHPVRMPWVEGTLLTMLLPVTTGNHC